MAWQIPRLGSPSRDTDTNVAELWIPKESNDYFNAPPLVQTPAASDKATTPYNENTLPAKYIHPREGVHQYGLNWFSRRLHRPVRRGVWLRVSYAVFGLVSLMVWIGITVFFAQDEDRYQRHNDYNEFSSQTTALDQGAGLLQFEGSLKAFDPQARILTISWTPQILLPNGTVSPFGVDENTTYWIGIWRDYNLVVEDRQVPTAILQDFRQPIYRVDNISAPAIAQIGVHPWDQFDTDIDLSQAVRNSAWRQPLFGFPFDKWSGSITFVANFMDFALASNLTNSFGLPVNTAYLVDSIINWRVFPSVSNTCYPPGSIWPDPNTVSKCNLEIDFLAVRPTLVIMATMIALVTNWLSTLFIFIMTCEGVVMQRAAVIEGPQLLAVCFTALFALPSVRAILPGAPDFGALIDLIGIIPNVIVVSLCTTAVAIETLRNMHRKAATIE